MTEASATAPRLEVQGVTKSFGSTAVLNGIDLALNAHEVVCLIGPSGCGKSTLLRCIDLLEPVDDGQISIDGTVVTGKGTDPNIVRRNIGIVFQAFNLFPHMTVMENVILGAVRVHKEPKAQAIERAQALLAQFGLEHRANEYPNKISGGQQQRAAIVRALMGNPRLLLLDEVTSALDPELVGEVLRAIRDLADGGMTMLLATHEMGFAREVANTVHFLHEGRVLESGPPAQIFTEPTQPRTQQFLARVLDAGRL